jgi:hypothetical protein
MAVGYPDVTLGVTCSSMGPARVGIVARTR